LAQVSRAAQAINETSTIGLVLHQWQSPEFKQAWLH